MIKSLQKIYDEKIQSDGLTLDPVQQQALSILGNFYLDIENSKPGLLARLTGKKQRGTGVYFYGGVGRGKTMIMDLFGSNLPNTVNSQRLHFHEFMLRAHDFMHIARQEDKTDSALLRFASQIRKESQILCFDEFHVTDIANAMILGRLFNALFNEGVNIVITTNWPPDDLYKDGLQRDLFLPFIEMLKNNMTVFHLDSGTDYRLRAMEEEGTFFYPLGDQAVQNADHLFDRLIGHVSPIQDTIEVKGRNIIVPESMSGIARFSFADLCERPHGAADYLAIAKKYHTVFVVGVPKLTYDRRNETKRFMTLVDTLYDKRIKMITVADAAPDKLYRGDQYEFEFQRTVSRLIEMQSADYIREIS